MQRKLKQLYQRLTGRHPVLGALPVIALTLACAGGIGATSALAAPAANTAWVIAVDGQILGAADQEAALQALYETAVDRYDTQDVLSLEVLSQVEITAVEAGQTADAPREETDILSALEEALSVQTVSQVSETVEIPYTTVTVEDDTLYTDESYTEEGHAGEQQVVQQVVRLNGESVLTKAVSAQVLTPAQDTLVHVGTQERPEFVWPAHGSYTGSYGIDTINGANRKHSGIDIAAASGTAICAARAGTVVYAGWDNGGYGNLVVIQHDNGTHTYYAHNSSIYVSVGDSVEQGEQIAAMGATGRVTGVHCHFEVRSGEYAGLYVAETLNPMDYLDLRDL